MASNKKKSRTRDYEMKARARKVEETRQRITEAAVELHGSVGPARTTVTEVAERAGVGRMTVYNHFPSDGELLEACSSHWLGQNPPPDAEAWLDEKDPKARLARGLAELYRWYRGGREMMAHSLRDEDLLPALAEVMARRWWPYVDRMVEILADGREEERSMVLPLLELAVDFHTWETLVEAGLDDREAADLAASLPCAAAGRV